MKLAASRLLALAAAAVLGAVPFAAYVRIGEQPYRPCAFAERVRLLGDVPGIEASWSFPAFLSLGACGFALITALVPRRWHRRLLPFAAGALVLATLLSYRMARNSTLASAAIGVHLLATGTVVLILAAICAREFPGSAGGGQTAGETKGGAAPGKARRYGSDPGR